MEPRIQYAKTSDGVRIACCATGEGVPLVLLQGLPGHLQLDWEIFREAYESFSQRGYRLIRLDFAGSGLSDHAGVLSFEMLSFEKYALSIEAVAAYFGLESFALFAQGPASPIAIAFAASRPERVSHLVLWEGFAAFEQIATESQIQALFALLDTDYMLYTKTIASAVLGWAAGDVARRYAAMLREGQTAEEARRSARAWRSLDARPFLSEVRAPTLIAHRFGFALVPVDVLRELSAEIPNATLVLLEGETADVRPLYSPQMRRVLDEFLLGAAAQPIDVDPLWAAATEGSGTLPSGTAVILFADIADSTALTERLGDTAFRAKARELDTALRSIIRDHAGRPIEGKLLGDGVLAVFTSARQAIEAAVACGRSGDDAGLPLHLGLHAGDVIREDNNVYGGAVNIASRISGLSASGEVLVSDTVRSLARTSAGVMFEDRGEQALKGVGEKVRVWAVRGGGE